MSRRSERQSIYPKGGKVDFLMTHFKQCAGCKDGAHLHRYYDAMTQFGQDALVWPMRIINKSVKLSDGARALVFAAWVGLIPYRTSLLPKAVQRANVRSLTPHHEIQFKRPAIKRQVNRATAPVFMVQGGNSDLIYRGI